MEDPDFKKDWMTTVTSKEFRRDYFNRPIRVNEKKKKNIGYNQIIPQKIIMK